MAGLWRMDQGGEKRQQGPGDQIKAIVEVNREMMMAQTWVRLDGRGEVPHKGKGGVKCDK